MIQILIEAGADLTVKQLICGSNIIHLAAGQPDFKIFEYLNVTSWNIVDVRISNTEKNIKGLSHTKFQFLSYYIKIVRGGVCWKHWTLITNSEAVFWE